MAIIQSATSAGGASFCTELALASSGIFVLADWALLDADGAVQVDIETIDEEATGAVPGSPVASSAVGVAHQTQVRSGVGILAVRTGLVASIAAEDKVVGSGIVSSAGSTRELVSIEAATAVVMTEDTSVVGVETEVTIRTSDQTLCTVQIVVDDASHVAAVGTVSGILSTGQTRFMALLAAVVEGELEPAGRTVQHALAQERVLEILLARVGGTDSAPGALCQAGAEAQDAAVSTVLTEAAVRVAVLTVGTCGHALEGLVVEEVAMTAASVGSAVVRPTHTCDAVETAEVALVA